MSYENLSLNNYIPSDDEGKLLDFLFGCDVQAQSVLDAVEDDEMTAVPQGLLKRHCHVTAVEGRADLWLILEEQGAKKVPIRAREARALSAVLRWVSEGLVPCGEILLSCGTRVIMHKRYRGAVRISLDQLYPSLLLKRFDVLILALQLSDIFRRGP